VETSLYPTFIGGGINIKKGELMEKRGGTKRSLQRKEKKRARRKATLPLPGRRDSVPVVMGVLGKGKKKLV